MCAVRGYNVLWLIRGQLKLYTLAYTNTNRNLTLMSTKPNTNLTLTVEVDNGEDFDDVQFAYLPYFHYNFTVTRNALRKVERN